MNRYQRKKHKEIKKVMNATFHIAPYKRVRRVWNRFISANKPAT